MEEREVVSRELAKGGSRRSIARLLGRHHSMISREVNRNGGDEGYRATDAERRAVRERKRPKQHKLVANARLHDFVCNGLGEKWSPQQIAGRLQELHPNELDMRVSHETIYQALFLQARGELRTQLKLALRTGRTKRVSPSHIAQTRGRIVDMVNISERPQEADDRAVPGFWEGDLILGTGNKSQIATLVERTTRFVMLVRIPYDRTAERVSYLLARKMETLRFSQQG